ncbi:GNAT family N-acetyltransferase [Phyllobacterium pellucidum]|uniref:GNAT family N-acetyltransferase n=1 Tax=Phyllobacterium pellucidum TaxID=2740464 RepID=UPI001D13A130|nr:GNAT family N-acetyltransferase [Phyllobacterium sp. T1018]UGY08175.1 GNAT family N-acetyltransferase [Phyllobacterium sp. T1018]
MVNVVLRELKPGDLGWVIHRQAILYAEEYSLNCEFEALLARICADFIKSYDPDREMVWIAEIDDVVVGSVFLMQGSDPTEARLRLLYVEPNIRGAGAGSTLVTASIERARAIGYRRLILWTDSALSAARRLYARHGFVKVAEQAHTSFGQDLIGETWSLDLGL